MEFSDTTLFFDIETHSYTERYAMSPREYFRLGGFSWGESEEVFVTEDYDEMISVLRSASMAVGHNIHHFDLSVLFGVDSIEPVRFARARKVFDTYIHATLANPAPEGTYLNRDGVVRKSTKPEEYRRWYGLDNQAFQLGVEGKRQDVLGPLAESFLYTEEPVFSPKTGKLLKRTKKTRRDGVCCGFGAIPLDHPEFREYLEQDVRATRAVARALLEKMSFDRYAQREQLKAAIDSQISRNGFRVDQELMLRRIKDMAEEAAYALRDLHRRFGFPLHGKKPTATLEGKEAILTALKAVGVREKDFDRTDKGALSFSGDSVLKAAKAAESVDALRIAELVAMLAGQRSLAELTQASLHADGRVHPSIEPLQRSGRKSTTDPGLTIWDDHHKDYYVADSDDQVLIEYDLSNADARAVAAMSGDRKFAERFEPGADGHLINAWAAWGKDKVGLDKTDPATAAYRQRAKAPGHGWGYRMGATRCARTTGLSVEEAKEFLGNLNRAFPGVVRWQDRVCGEAARNGFVLNDWGRLMPITGSYYTQPPALLGQSTTNEMLADGLIRLPERFLRMVKLTIHDALIFSIPVSNLERDREAVVRYLSGSFAPRVGGQRIFFPVGYGKPGRTWKEAAH